MIISIKRNLFWDGYYGSLSVVKKLSKTVRWRIRLVIFCMFDIVIKQSHEKPETNNELHPLTDFVDSSVL